jgi:hypothetical protein
MKNLDRLKARATTVEYTLVLLILDACLSYTSALFLKRCTAADHNAAMVLLSLLAYSKYTADP